MECDVATRPNNLQPHTDVRMNLTMKMMLNEI